MWERNRGVFQIHVPRRQSGVPRTPTNDVYLEETTRLVKDEAKYPIVNQIDAGVLRRGEVGYLTAMPQTVARLTPRSRSGLADECDRSLSRSDPR